MYEIDTDSLQLQDNIAQIYEDTVKENTRKNSTIMSELIYRLLRGSPLRKHRLLQTHGNIKAKELLLLRLYIIGKTYRPTSNV